MLLIITLCLYLEVCAYVASNYCITVCLQLVLRGRNKELQDFGDKNHKKITIKFLACGRPHVWIWMCWASVAACGRL